jgi:hypothetical protein
MYLSPRLCLSLALCFALHSATLSVNAKAPEGEVLAAPINRLPQGGGVIYPAWKGEYWANPVLEGSPAYARSDIRVSFDWETWRPVLGVHAESVRIFPRDRFSARWTGQLLARFDED